MTSHDAVAQSRGTARTVLRPWGSDHSRPRADSPRSTLLEPWSRWSSVLLLALVVVGCGAPSPGGRSETIEGTLEMGDELLESGELADAHFLEGTAGEFVRLDLRSEEFDPYLILVTPSGEQFENDDYGGDSARSMLALDLTETGEYRAIVTAYAPGEAGRYRFAIERFPGAPGASEGRVERGMLAEGDYTLDSGEMFDVYELEGQPGQRVRLDLSSDELDTYLILVAPNGEQIENDDAEDGRAHSVIETELREAGTYSVLVTSYSIETGAYELSIDLAAPSSTAGRGRDVISLAMGRAMDGSLAAGDERLEGGQFFDRYAFDASPGQPILLELASDELDTFLILQFPDGTLVANDDSLDQVRTSRVELMAPQAGRYHVSATSYSEGETGKYRLSLGAGDAMSVEAPPSEVGGSVRALLVGISEYGGRATDLPYTATDALRVRDALVGGAGMSPDDGIVLLDSDATVGNFYAALAELAARTRPEDLFVLFFSGHGGRQERQVPQAADPDFFDETLTLFDADVTDDELHEVLEVVRAERVLIVLDSCFSGGFSKDVIAVPGRMGLFSSEEDVTSSVADKFRAGGYLAVFLADSIQHGLADDGDGLLTALELSEYIRQRYRSDIRGSGSGDYVRTSGPQIGYQHLVVDRGSIGPYQTLLRVAGSR